MIPKLALILLTLFLLVLPAAAQDDTVSISWPPPVYDLSGTVSVRGMVNTPNLLNFFLEVSDYEAETPTWIPVSLPNLSPVTATDGILAQWVTTLVPDGIYTLRLHVQLQSGEALFATVGPLRVANQLVRPDGETQIITQPILATPTLPPATSGDTLVPRPQVINDLPVEVGGHVLHFNDDTKELMRTAGLTWVKWQIPFRIGEDLVVARDRINWTHEAGFKVLLSITGEVDELREMGEEYYPVFAEFLGQVAALSPDAIEVWNEMNLDREWPQGRIDPRAYAAMLQPAYQAIKAADPQVMVITGALAPTGAEGAFGLARVWNDDRYYQGMANAGVADFADCIGVHYNEGIIAPIQRGGDPRQPDYPTRYFLSMTERAYFPFRNLDIPLCYTELGYLSPEGFDRLPSGFEWAANTSVEEQATWLKDAIILAGADERIEMIIIWNVDFELYEADPQAGFAIIRPDGTCPACETIASVRGT